MNNNISVIIPTYKSPELLDLCLQSAIKGQVNKNQIIVVIDGFYELNKDILEKYSNDIDILNLEVNQGLCRATNLGVYNAIYSNILIVNDDNIFPNKWDEKLLKLNNNNYIWTPNQIEPFPSMFKQFNINNLGTTASEFDLFKFWEYEEQINTHTYDLKGSTLPIYMNKKDYLMIGGWDENYPKGLVADWDFFLKCSLNNYTLCRSYSLHFYHFTSQTVNGNERIIAEQHAHEYAKYKWGNYIQHNPDNNLKFINVNY